MEVLVETQKPPHPVGEMIMIHGLEGSSEAGYMRTLAHHCLENNLIAHRFHMRTCGGTEHLCKTLYHGGLTSDLLAYLTQLRSTLPVFLTGFSLGGNVVLKLAGELGERGPDMLAGVCGVSAPIDLGMAARRISQRLNVFYQRRFVGRMRTRLTATGRYTEADFAGLKSLYEIDDKITAPSFGMGNAEDYYGTQSANRFLPAIRVPTLLIAAQDDPLIPFRMYEQAAPERNAFIRTIYPKHGGHLGFIARRKPRFWADETIVDWALGRIEDRVDTGFTGI